MAEVPSSWLVPAWPAPANVRALVTTRDGPELVHDSPFGFNVGTRCGDDPAAVARNRAWLCDALALPAAPCWLQQVHGDDVFDFDRPHPNPPPQAGEGDQCVKSASRLLPPFRREGDSLAQSASASLPPFTGEGARRADGGNAVQEPQADAAVTGTPGVVLAIQTADCLPLLFCADDGSEIGAAHAGWRGLSAGVLESTLAAMHTPRANVLAWLGPAIAARSYEVGDEVRDAFLAHAPAAVAAFTATRPGHWQCDLYALARQRLHAAGVTRVFGGGFDTYTDPRLHSFRRDGAHSGRMVSLVWMAPTGD